MPRTERDGRATEAPERNLLARDSYRSTATLAILIVLWLTLLTLLGLPFPRTYYVVRLTVVALALASLAYLARTWRRPRLRVSLVILMIEIGATASLMAWGGRLGAELGEQWQPIASAQLTIAAIPLITPPFAWAGYVLIAGFTAELLAILVYQQYLGVGPWPAAEPFLSLCISVLAVAVLMVREQRRRMALALIRLRAEEAALCRLAPLFTLIHVELDREIRALDAIETSAILRSGAFSRSLQRLSALGDQLDALSPRSTASLAAEERAKLANDSQAGALIFAIAGVTVASLAAWGAHLLWGAFPEDVLWGLVIAYAAIVVWLWQTRGHPSFRRGVLASVLLVALAAIVTLYLHVLWERTRPLGFPYIGHKLLMMTLVLFRTPHLWLGATLLALITVAHLAIQVVLGAHPALEPWHTLMFALIAFGYLVMGEQRRIASIKLLHAEANVASLHRRAKISLALCDQLNTPLQILTSIIAIHPPSAATDEAAVHIERLSALSGKVSSIIDKLSPDLRLPSLDSGLELTRRI